MLGIPFSYWSELGTRSRPPPGGSRLSSINQMEEGETRLGPVDVNGGGQAIIGNVNAAGPHAAGSLAHSVDGVIAPSDKDC